MGSCRAEGSKSSFELSHGDGGSGGDEDGGGDDDGGGGDAGDDDAGEGDDVVMMFRAGYCRADGSR